MKTILLVGAGHAHLEIINRLPAQNIKSNRIVLISTSEKTYYSGLIPRLITGEIHDAKIVINSADYARSRGFHFVEGKMSSFDPNEKTVTLESGEILSFDFLSINIGAAPKEIPTLSPYNTIYLKPFDRFIDQWRTVQRICSSCMSPNFVVIGGGAAAVEVATALKVRLNNSNAKKSEVHLVTKSKRLCETYSEATSEKIHEALLRNNIAVHFNEPIDTIGDKSISLNNGKTLSFDAIFVATPTVPSSLSVDSHLRLTENIFACGDVLDTPLPRSGVIAVHQGRYLTTAISHLLKSSPTKPFVPPKNQINILITGRDTAILVWGKHSVLGRWPRLLKDWIDQNYMKKFRNL